jgi:phosphatidylglycerol:prolipoprotein diacylglycerol transferase
MVRARRYGVDPDLMLSLATWLLPAGIVGARVFYIVQYWEEKFRQPTLWETIVAMLSVTEGGLVVYGCMLAGSVALIAFIYRYRLPGLALTDLIAPSVVLGMGLGRVGCFLNGCCYGGLCDLPWSVSFPWNSPPHISQVERGMLYLHGLQLGDDLAAAPVILHVEPGSSAERAGLQAGQRIATINEVPVKNVGGAEFLLLQTYGEGTPLSIALADGSPPKHWQIEGPPPRSLPVHPAQLYSAIDALLLCFFLLAYDPYRRRDGELAAIVLTIYPITRFLIEIIRVDEAAVFQTGLSISQNISVAILVGGLGLWAYLFCRPRGLAWPRPLAATT